MKRSSHILVLLLVVLMASSALGQTPYRGNQAPSTLDHLRTGGYDASESAGLLDPSRIEMNHSLGMGYASVGGEGFSQGYYMNSLSYRFDAPVLLRLRTGVTNNPFASSSGNMSQPGQPAMASLMQNAEFFGGADLLWQPKENMLIQLSVDRLPGSMMMGYPGMMGYGMRQGLWDMYAPYGSSRYDRFGSNLRRISAER